MEGTCGPGVEPCGTATKGSELWKSKSNGHKRDETPYGRNGAGVSVGCCVRVAERGADGCDEEDRNSHELGGTEGGAQPKGGEGESVAVAAFFVGDSEGRGPALPPGRRSVCGIVLTGRSGGWAVREREGGSVRYMPGGESRRCKRGERQSGRGCLRGAMVHRRNRSGAGGVLRPACL